MSKKRKKSRRKSGKNDYATNSKNRHHLVNKCRGGDGTVNNLLTIYVQRHRAWHLMFKNMDLDQAIGLLERVKRAKANQGGYHESMGQCVLC